MSRSRQADPRANQKARTRAALVEAAAALLRQGRPPTVAEAADEAKVSRATAYRYFATQEALLLEVTDLPRAVASIEALVDSLDDADAEARLAKVIEAFTRIVLAEEMAMRTALRGYMDTWLAARRDGADGVPIREGRRMRWLDRILEPVRGELSPKQWTALERSLALTLGIEPVIVMRDVCKMTEDGEVVAVLRRSAVAILRGALEEARAPRRGRSRGAS